MDEDIAHGLRVLALQLVGITAVIHLVYALPRLPVYAPTALAVYAERGLVPPPRPALFLLTTLAIVGGVVATRRGLLELGTAYRLGIALMAVLVISWVGWHTVLDHGAVLTGTVGADGLGGGSHHDGVLDTVVAHYVEPLVAVVVGGASQPGANAAFLGVVSKTVELAAVVVFAVLLRGDPRVARAERRDAAESSA